jgi:aldose 1-epimerase
MRFILALLIFATPLLAQKGVTVEPWGKTAGGEHVELYTLTNAGGGQARIATYGGVVVSLTVPDKAGKLADVVLGFDSLAGYTSKSTYLGALIGRYGNRIAKGRFSLEGRTYTLAVNNGQNALHGGLRGFDARVWAAVPFDGADGPVGVSYVSEDGEEGYPGTLPFACAIPGRTKTRCASSTQPTPTRRPS